MGIAVNDRLEAELPRSGHYSVTDGNHHSSLDTGADSIREAYASQYRSNQELTARRLRELRIPLLKISTGDDPLEATANGISCTMNPDMMLAQLAPLRDA